MTPLSRTQRAPSRACETVHRNRQHSEILTTRDPTARAVRVACKLTGCSEGEGRGGVPGRERERGGHRKHALRRPRRPQSGPGAPRQEFQRPVHKTGGQADCEHPVNGGVPSPSVTHRGQYGRDHQPEHGAVGGLARSAEDAVGCRGPGGGRADQQPRISRGHALAGGGDVCCQPTPPAATHGWCRHNRVSSR